MEARALIGWNLRRLRVAKGLSQERLALLADIDRAYVGRVERGSENVTISTLEAMAVALAVPVAALFIEPEAGAEPPMPLRAGRRAKDRVNLDTGLGRLVAPGASGASRADLQLRGDSDEEGPSCVDRRAGPGVEVARSECRAR